MTSCFPRTTSFDRRRSAQSRTKLLLDRRWKDPISKQNNAFVAVAPVYAMATCNQYKQEAQLSLTTRSMLAQVPRGFCTNRAAFACSPQSVLTEAHLHTRSEIPYIPVSPQKICISASIYAYVTSMILFRILTGCNCDILGDRGWPHWGRQVFRMM